MKIQVFILEKCGDYNQTESVVYYQSATISPDDYSYYETITSDGGISVSTNDDAQGILLVLKVSFIMGKVKFWPAPVEIITSVT